MASRVRYERVVLLAGWIAVFAGGLRAQSLVREALASFPQDTLRIEYSHLTALRALPDYPALRQRYEGPRLQELEKSFARLGIQEGDVDELVLGWKTAGQHWVFYGLTSGRFNPGAMAERAAGQGLTPVKIGDDTAFCLGAEGGANCVVLLGDALGAFGPLASLRALVEVRSGKASSLGANSVFSKLAEGEETNSPIWGVAVGAAVPDWFRSWMPNQTDLKIDWSQAFKSVEALAYSIDAGQMVRLKVGMDCATSADAVSLRQVFDGIRIYQQLSWQNQNPGRPNPFQKLAIDANDRRVSIVLDTPYSEIMPVTGPGTT